DAAQHAFGCRIGHTAGASAHAEGPADVDNLAIALRHHCREYRAHGVEAAVHVERDDVIELVLAGLYAGLADWPRAAGNIDKDVNSFAVVGARRLCCRGALCPVGHVTADDDDFAAAGFYLPGKWL